MPHPVGHPTVTEIRCAGCNRLLFVADFAGVIRIVCPRSTCKRLTTVRR